MMGRGFSHALMPILHMNIDLVVAFKDNEILLTITIQNAGKEKSIEVL